jgi:hypothetical protein
LLSLFLSKNTLSLSKRFIVMLGTVLSSFFRPAFELPINPIVNSSLTTEANPIPKRTSLQIDTFERKKLSLSNPLNTLRSGTVSATVEKAITHQHRLKTPPNIDLSSLENLSLFQLQSLVTKLMCQVLPQVIDREKADIGSMICLVLKQLYEKADNDPAIQGSVLYNAEQAFKKLLPTTEALEQLDKVYSNFAENSLLNPFRDLVS